MGRFFGMGLLPVLVFFGALAAGEGSLLSRRGRGAQDACKGSACCGMAHYPVGDPQLGTTIFSSVFDVPGLPTAEVDTSITDFIYFNIFFAGGAPSGLMNQFVPQLMLGEPLCNSTGPPYYKPLWCAAKSYIFGTQYFMEVHNTTTNKTDSHAAAGAVFETTPGERLFTEFSLGEDWTWTLKMGVVGDEDRVSVLEAFAPYMGLLASETRSWSEPAFDHVNVNSCWELYGMRDREHYPSTGSTNAMTIARPPGSAWDWDTAWVEDETPTCPGAPTSAIAETHNETHQVVTWTLSFDDAPRN